MNLTELKTKLNRKELSLKSYQTRLTYDLITESELDEMIALEDEIKILKQEIQEMIKSDPEYIRAQYVISSVFKKIEKLS